MTQKERTDLYDYWVVRLGTHRADVAAALADAGGDLSADGPHRWNPCGGDAAYIAWQSDDRFADPEHGC